jgi:hypothetical protein
MVVVWAFVSFPAVARQAQMHDMTSPYVMTLFTLSGPMLQLGNKGKPKVEHVPVRARLSLAESRLTQLMHSLRLMQLHRGGYSPKGKRCILVLHRMAVP